jgi:prevent-host-death family protein
MPVLVAISVPLAQTVERAEAEKERVILTRDGRPVAALVPLADVVALEMIGDTADTAAAVAALTEWEAGGRPLGATLEELARQSIGDVRP